MIIPSLDGKQLILASKSPRRKQLLEELGLEFKLRTKEVEESYPGYIEPEKVAEFLSQKKAAAFKESLADNEIVITADTTVLYGKTILNKPADADEARSMLLQLSSGTHQVITGVTLLSKEKEISFSDTTEVEFARLTTQELDYYINNFKPYDKAGAYGIQEWIGLAGIVGIKGSYPNVVGLPVQKLYQALQGF